ncbi:MAG: SCP2 sterol-binding domain-containing protein [Pseudonocardiaceae bacterium]
MADINDIDPRTLSTEEFARRLGSVYEDGAERHSSDITGMDPQAFARLIKRASKEQIDAVMSDPALRAPVLDEVFGRVAGQFRADRAPRKDSAIHWRITGDGEPDRYETWIAGGTCSASAEPSHEPRVTLTMSGEQFLQLVSGNSSPTMMFMTGKLTLEGDIGFAANLTDLFDIPKA